MSTSDVIKCVAVIDEHMKQSPGYGKRRGGMNSSGADNQETRMDLMLSGHRLRLASSDRGLLSAAASALIPPCLAGNAAGAGIGWSVVVRAGVPGRLERAEDAGLPVLSWPGPGRQLAVLRHDAGGVAVAARYRHGSPAALIEADTRRRRTLVSVPSGDAGSGRWADWVARAFFGSRLLAGGWRLVHASAVRLPMPAGERAVVVLAGRHGGKSTVAYRACTELGGALMADDLVLMRPGLTGVEVIGWPARACVPAEVLSGDLLASLPADMLVHTEASGIPRSRVVLSPPECERALGIPRAGPAPLGGIVCLSRAPGGGTGCEVRAMDAAETAGVLAASAATPAQRLMMTDLLGLAGGPAAHARDGRSREVSWPRALAEVPAVATGLADMSALPRMPLRELSGGLLPCPEAAQ